MEESKRLLAVGDQDVEPQGFGRGAGPRGGARTFWRKQICLMYLTAVHTFLLFSVLGNVYQAYQSDAYVERLTIFPEMRFLRQVIKNEHPEHGERYSNYTGRPNNDTAKAWDGLLQPFYFNASASELQSDGFDPDISVRVADGGYLANLGVYHELHCLNQLRNFIYLRDPLRQATQSPLTHEQLQGYQGHLDHCLEVLRLSVTCAADLSFYTFTWPKEKNFTFLDAHSHSPRKCVDWSQIEEWSVKRKVSLTPTVVLPEDEE